MLSQPHILRGTHEYENKVRAINIKNDPAQIPLRDVNFVQRLTTLILALMATFIYLTLLNLIHNTIEE